jgi:hypothetical protein
MIARARWRRIAVLRPPSFLSPSIRNLGPKQAAAFRVVVGEGGA